MTILVTEHEFELPRGYVDADGNLHRQGTMRLATAADEIQPLRDPRVQELPAYLIVLLLSRVIVRLGTLQQVHAGLVEGLFAEDLAYLQELYNRLNGFGPMRFAVGCPKCRHEFDAEVMPAGGSWAAP